MHFTSIHTYFKICYCDLFIIIVNNCVGKARESKRESSFSFVLNVLMLHVCVSVILIHSFSFFSFCALIIMSKVLSNAFISIDGFFLSPSSVSGSAVVIICVVCYSTIKKNRVIYRLIDIKRNKWMNKWMIWNENTLLIGGGSEGGYERKLNAESEHG